MNKTAIKNFAIWARNKLIADVSYDARLIGITEDGIAKPLPQSFGGTQFFDIGTAEPYSISGEAVHQRDKLIEVIQQKEKDTDYKTAYQYVIEEVAYTWFNRLIAIRFMEVNDYLPSHIRVLSSESGKLEPDLVTTPFDAELPFTAEEKEQILQLKQDNKLDELFRILFLKQCNALNEILPALFEKTKNYTELLLSLSVIDQDGVVYHLTHDIPEDDFNIERGGQVEIIGWLYQYYNTEPKAAAFAKNGKITKEEIPAVTQLFTPDWIVRYMVENSLGRLWVEGHPDCGLKENWKYYLEEAQQEPEVQAKLSEIRKEYAALNPEDIKLIEPCMGSGHILVYVFDVLMQIYESAGYSQRDAVKSILEHNIYGLDIDDRAYQLAYFAVMMKACQYDKRFLRRKVQPHVYAIAESNHVDHYAVEYFCNGDARLKTAMDTILKELRDAKEYGSILNVTSQDCSALYARFDEIQEDIHISREAVLRELLPLVQCAEAMGQKYMIAVTNPPYLSARGGMTPTLTKYLSKNYSQSKNDLFTVFMDVCTRMLQYSGLYSMVNQHSWMFLAGFAKMREKMYASITIDNMIQIGAGAFEGIAGEVVQSVAFVIRNRINEKYRATYIDMTNGKWKNYMQGFLKISHKYEMSIREIKSIPNGILCYHLGGAAISQYYKGKRLDSFADPRVGMATGDNELFVRLWQEVDYHNIGFDVADGKSTEEKEEKWYPYNKGGECRRWYGNRTHVVDWFHNGQNITAYKQGRLLRGEIEKKNSECWNREYYFMESISWSKVSSGRFAVRYYEPGFIFDVAGCSILGLGENLYYVMGALNSELRNVYIESLSPTLNFETGAIKAFPIIKNEDVVERVTDTVKKCIQLEKIDWDEFEVSWSFSKHPFVRLSKDLWDATAVGASMHYYYGGHPEVSCPLELCNMLWQGECNERFNQLKSNEEELNRIFIDIYGLQDELTPEVEDKDVTVRKADLQRDIKSLLSYAVGCMFGRYSTYKDGLLFAGEPYSLQAFADKLNDRPGTISADELERAYRNEGVVVDEMFFPDADNVIPITDEEYLDDDIVSRLCTWLKAVYGADTLEANLDYIAKALGNKGSTSREIIRNYFLNDFFKDHCQTYSVTGSGKRPIYWLFDSGKQNGFKALIYLHRYTPDTIGNLRIDYLHKMQRVYESEINRMQDMMDHSENAREVAAAGKRKDKLAKQLKECREYDEKISHLALSRIALDLDDGVKVNYRKLQTAADGKFYEVLADSKNIMAKQRGKA